MHPVICKIGFLTVYSYGVMLAAAVFVCSFFLGREARAKGMDPAVIFDLIFWVVIAGLLGARIFYILLNWPFFMDNPREIIMIQNGGLAWQGSLIAGIFAGGFFIHRRKLPLLSTLDLAAPYIALGQAIGRIGCFLNGCCYGKPAAWGIYFPVHDARLHPTQLYESFGLFLIFLILKQYQKEGRQPGQVFLLYLGLAPLLRFVNEFFRADHETLWLGLSIFQWVCLVLIASAVYGKFLLHNRAGK